MPLIDLDSIPSASMRRWFGLSLAVVLALLALLLSRFGRPLNIALLTASVMIGLTYYIWPRSQLTIIRGWLVLTYPVAWIAGHILFSLIFFGIVLPIAMVLRVRGHDPLRLRKADRSSNWQDRPPPPPAERYFKQF